MAILVKFIKLKADVQDYDISFVDYLASITDTAASFTATVEPGINMFATAMTGGVVKLWFSGGADEVSYKVTVTVTTAGGRVKQAEIVIKVKEV